MRELSLYSGVGGGLLGTHLLGWECVGYVEWNDYCQRVLRQRIIDGALPCAPIFGDVRAFIDDGYAAAYQGLVDVVTGGFPCQPFSFAGRRKGAEDDRNMWPATRDVLRAVRPRYVFLENVPGLLADGYIQRVFADLAECGFDARWSVLGGHDVGAIADGKRLWIVAAAPDSPMPQGLDIYPYCQPGTQASFRRQRARAIRAAVRPDDYARIKRDTDAVARGMERLEAIGNGQIPRVVELAWKTMT